MQGRPSRLQPSFPAFSLPAKANTYNKRLQIFRAAAYEGIRLS